MDNKMDSFQRLESLCRQSWDAMKTARPEIDVPVYADRIKHELSVIKQLQFPDYFLIVADIVNFARSNDIFNTSRGSVGGSLVAYLLGVSDIDPIEYGLYFERFLNPDRVSMPDIDLDFDSRRDEVLDYIKQKYGSEYVAAISTTSRFKPKGVVRELAKAMGVDEKDAESISHILGEYEDVIGEKNWTAFEIISELQPYLSQYPAFFESARYIIGRISHLGKHPCGVIISPNKLIDEIPLSLMVDHGVASQWDKDALEKMGFLKFDVLKVAMLDVVKECTQGIRTMESDFNIRRIPLDDGEVFDDICAGHTAGAFQINTYGFQKVCRQVQPRTIRELIAVVALFRPGAKDYIGDYVKNRDGKFGYLVPELEPILKETFGIIVYQEQSMRIFVDLAGMTPGEADMVRRSISKKTGDMEKYAEPFVDGCKTNGVPSDKAVEIFEIIKKSENYSFNKSHCITGDMLVRDCNSGEYHSIELLHESGLFKSEDIFLKSLVKDGLVRDRLIDVFETGEQEVFEVELENGIVIRCTMDHKFYCDDGKEYTLRDIISGGMNILIFDEGDSTND